MTLGFHIPFTKSAPEIEQLGERLLADGTYRWVELKYPHDVEGFDGAAYEAAAKRLVADYDVGVSLHIPTHYDIGIWSSAIRAVTMNQVHRAMEFAADLGATVAAVHPGTIMHMDIPSAPLSPMHERLIAAAESRKGYARSLTVEALRGLAERADALDLTLAVENVLLPEEIVYTAGQLISILDEVAHPRVRALYDCGHAHRCGLDQAEYVSTLGDRLCHTHINDNDGTCDLHLQIGQGSIDYGALFGALARQGYAGAVVVETSYRDASDLVESARLLRGFIDSAKRQI